MTVSDYKIREARARDAEALSELMRGLHAHLKESTQHITTDKLIRDVLDEDSVHIVLVAERDGDLLGYALFHETYESIYAQRGFYMADLFVVEEARRDGLGRALVAAVASVADERNLKFIWWVSEAWDEEAQAFYATLGAEHDPMIAHSVSHDTFTALAEEGKKKSPSA
jgi:GNAT superfamily N-acetyltransferase